MDLYNSKPVKAGNVSAYDQVVLIPVLTLIKSNPLMIIIDSQFRLLRVVQISLL
jgi:hypothetical protein